MTIPDLDSFLASKNLGGFWNVRVPSHRPEMPYQWKWNDIYEGLLKAKDTIGFELAERRSIRLIDPQSPSKSTSRALQFSFSIVNPGEVARAHRHNMAAIRFVAQGNGAYTIVEGERFLMQEGDLILTPNWTWHDHVNHSKETIIWLDGLDGPLIHNFNVLFFEEYKKPTQVVLRNDGDSTRRLGFARPVGKITTQTTGVPFRYRWEDTYSALQSISDSDADAYDGNLIRFVNPIIGGFTLPTMSCEIQLLKPGQITQSHRHTSTSLYYVFRGRGRTAVGESFLEWQKGDCFVLPLWLWHHHENPSEDEAVLFSINDHPLMESTGLYREEG
jgi:1-hydroxy-2-naphthoate dioxygenase